MPPYDPVAASTSDQPIKEDGAISPISTDIYGGSVEGDVSVHLSALPATLVPEKIVTDQAAEAFVGTSLDEFAGSDPSSPSAVGEGVRDLGVVTDNVSGGVAENITVLPKTRSADDASLGRTERILALHESSPLEATLLKNGFTQDMISAITKTLHNVYPSTDVITHPLAAG